ncbi:hypothetical protein F383_15690 [Gossypium arboreum]|uniref:Uncharacterized protein n=1 Tax=Gossypium arboreum TaxID=29729 RepID=A0A0B0PYH6_GOSAR|nr:hypothetical protein F383_15690 [Gossypium arboreum]
MSSVSLYVNFKIYGMYRLDYVLKC